MSDITIYHNTRCSKSRCALSILQDEGIEPEIRQYMSDTLDEGEIKSLLKKLNIKAEDLVRKGEAVYKEKYKGKNLTEAEWIEALVSYPKLIERPIIVKGDKAIIGRPPELVEEFLKEQ